MAEVAGLVVGGVALASLFETCMNTFDRIDAGRNCSRDYQEDALIITLLGSRLRRWEETYRASAPPSTVYDGELAEKALESVNLNLESLRKTAGRYQPKGESTNNVANVTERLQKLHVSSVPRNSNSSSIANKKQSLRSKIIWALHDKEKVSAIIKTVRFKIEELESLSSNSSSSSSFLFPTLLQQRADTDFKTLNLNLPAYTQQDPASNNKEDDIAILKRLAAQADPRFAEAILKATTGHYYENVLATGYARQNSGDFWADGYTGPTENVRHCYRNIVAEGNARQQVGNMYGKSVFDD